MRDAMIPLNPGFKPPPRGADLPHTDGEPMESWRHVEQMLLLLGSLNHAWRNRDDYFAAGNMFVYFSEIQAKKNDFRGPDFFVVMDTEKRERKSWVVWEEEGRTPDVVIELLSESTERVDRGDKMRVYAKLMHVAEYYLFDPFSGVLEGYELEASTRTYQRRSVDEQGRLVSRATGLFLAPIRSRYLGVEAAWLRWLNADGAVLPTGNEDAVLQTARADEHQARADKLAANVDRETARANEEAARADEEAARANEEAARANEEAARAEAALKRIAELEAQLAKR